MSSDTDLGFTTAKIKDGYTILHHNRAATQLRGARAQKFEMSMETMSFPEQQQLMARLTGNYKRGNEK
ncbi:MAG: hypothetical protein ACI9FB_000152 [Candidatus Azotimanducaceae bacterium]|jgi:hypothetical protein